MSSYDLIEKEPLSVSEYIYIVNTAVKRFRASVVGEISGRVTRRGAVTYFSIHDEKSEGVLSCMVFNNIIDNYGIKLIEGETVVLTGYPEIWPRTGSFSFKAFEVLLRGEGQLAKQFESLKNKLEGEGLFSEKRKRALPNFPHEIALITAHGREAEADFVTHLAQADLSVIIVDVKVEGVGSIDQICDAIDYVNGRFPDCEVLALVRGGGSLENLQSFNSERIARAISGSRIPIVCGVGHEKDVTIADMVADARASTPTHAAKLISNNWEKAPMVLQNYYQQIISTIRTLISASEKRLADIVTDLSYLLKRRFIDLEAKLSYFENLLHLASPTLKLKQGYSLTYDSNGKLIRSAIRTQRSEIIRTKLIDGEIKSRTLND